MRSRVKPAIVSTVRNAGAVIDSFIAYHRAIGFVHLFIFFDDPADPDLARIGTMQGVTAIAHDAGLREAWTKLPTYAEQGPFIAREVMARQVLNATLAMELARAQGFDWLLHIDSDELFLSPNESVTEHFEALQLGPADTITYRNYEALPEKSETGDWFREVDLFKVPPELFRGTVTREAMALLRSVTQLTPNFFHFYGIGKSAVRLASNGMEPKGVHHFWRPDGSAIPAEAAGQFILHYACCGFENFWNKYVTLGRFADRWWGQYDIKAMIGPLHLAARDVVATGDRAAALALYRERVALEDPQVIQALITLGFLMRFPQPKQILEAMPHDTATSRHQAGNTK
jgi:hypothetical protein